MAGDLWGLPCAGGGVEGGLTLAIKRVRYERRFDGIIKFFTFGATYHKVANP